MFFVVRSNDSFNFPLGLIKYIVIVIVVYTGSRFIVSSEELTVPPGKVLHCWCTYRLGFLRTIRRQNLREFVSHPIHLSSLSASHRQRMKDTNRELHNSETQN